MKKISKLLIIVGLLVSSFANSGIVTIAEEDTSVQDINLKINIDKELINDAQAMQVDVSIEHDSDTIIRKIEILEIGEMLDSALASFLLSENGAYTMLVEYERFGELNIETKIVEIEGIIKQEDIDLVSIDNDSIEMLSTIVHTGTIGTVDWTLDDAGVLTFGGGSLSIVSDWNSYWKSQIDKEKVVRIVFSNPVDAEGRLRYMFAEFHNLTTIDNLTNLDTSKVIDMNYMFRNSSSLTNLDVSNFDTGNVKQMALMFSGTSSLLNLDVSNFNTSNVTDMSGMFDRNSSLTNLDVSNFDTKNVTNMSMMFLGMSSLVSLDVSNFDTSNVTSMSAMFLGTSKLTSIDVSNFDTSKVTSMHTMFKNASKLVSLDLSNFRTNSLKDMYGMFEGASSLISLDLSSFDTSLVTGMGYMFKDATSLVNLNLSNFDTSNVTYMQSVFAGANSLTNLDISNFSFGNTIGSMSLYDFFGYRRIKELTIGSDFRFLYSNMNLVVIPTNSEYTGNWQHVGTGTANNPNGVVLTRAEFLAYDGTLPGTYVWEKTTPNRYDLAYDSNGGTGLMASTSHGAGDSVTLATNNFTAPTGTVFLGWSLAAEGIIGENDVKPVMVSNVTMGTMNMTVYAVWATDANGNGIADVDEVAATITLTYHQNNGRPNVNISLTVGGMIGGFTPVREGHRFEGWFLTPDFQVGTDYDHSYRPATSVNLYAKWSVIAYQARFEDWNGNMIEEVEYDFGTPIIVPNSPNREGYNFAGWTPVVESTMPARNVVYVATYTMKPVVTPTPTPTPTPIPSPSATPETVRTCQDDGYPNGYYWNGTACVIDAVAPPVVNAPVNQNRPNQPEEPNVEEDKIITPVIDTVTETPEAQLPETTVPEAEENIETIQPEITPLTGPGGWSILNVVLTGLATILAIIAFVVKKKKEETVVEESEEVIHLYKRNSIYPILMLVMTIGIAIFLMITHDFTLNSILVNQWTPIFIVMIILSILLFFFSLRWKEITE